MAQKKFKLSRMMEKKVGPVGLFFVFLVFGVVFILISGFFSATGNVSLENAKGRNTGSQYSENVEPSSPEDYTSGPPCDPLTGICITSTAASCQSDLYKGEMISGNVVVSKFDETSGIWSPACTISAEGGTCESFIVSNIGTSTFNVNVEQEYSLDTLCDPRGYFIKIGYGTARKYDSQGNLVNSISDSEATLGILDNENAVILPSGAQSSDYQLAVSDGYILQYQTGKVFVVSTSPPGIYCSADADCSYLSSQCGNFYGCQNNQCVLMGASSCSLCGNGNTDAEEECDDGNSVEEDSCLTTCRLNVCGDGIINNGVEQCDDGNTNTNDYCAYPSCQTRHKACVSNTCSWVSGAGADSCTTISASCGVGLPPSGGGCFTGDTLVSMENGNKKEIKDIHVGDIVMSYNEERGRDEPQKVLSLFPVVNKDYLVINSRVKVTADHPIWISGEWVRADSLKIGDELTGLNGEKEVIVSIQGVKDEVPVYNFEVQNTHTYYADNVRVHNAKSKANQLIQAS